MATSISKNSSHPTHKSERKIDDVSRESSVRTQLNRIEANKQFLRPRRILDFSRNRVRVCSIGHKNIVKIIFRHRKRKYASVGAKSLITRDSINAVGAAREFWASYALVSKYMRVYAVGNTYVGNQQSRVWHSGFVFSLQITVNLLEINWEWLRAGISRVVFSRKISRVN